ncbi:MAG TPA: NUDIX hydrolase, partial [Bradyrhizobium sp.]
MARALVLAAGGIVLRPEQTPLIAVVRLRKRNEWVLPKGKLDDGETPRDAAEREVLEETGHDVSVHEFLGTLVYESGGRFKVVHYWRMETSGEPSHELMDDVRAVDWLPLEAAVERLSRACERAFLANVGPLALEAAALARRSKARKPPALVKRGRRPSVVPQPLLTIPAPIAPPPDVMASPPQGGFAFDGRERSRRSPVNRRAIRGGSISRGSIIRLRNRAWDCARTAGGNLRGDNTGTRARKRDRT